MLDYNVRKKKSVPHWIEILSVILWKTWDRNKWQIKWTKQKQTTLVDKDITIFCNVMSIWNMYSYMHYTEYITNIWIEQTCNVPVQYQNYQINCHNPEHFLSRSSSRALRLSFGMFIFFSFGVPFHWMMCKAFTFQIYNMEKRAWSTFT